MDDALILRHFVHENGHMLFGWEDLYDTRGVSSAGIGPYGLMGGPARSNIWGPMPPNPYYRHLARWDEVTDLTDAPPGVYHLEANSNNPYRFDCLASLLVPVGPDDQTLTTRQQYQEIDR